MGKEHSRVIRLREGNKQMQFNTFYLRPLMMDLGIQLDNVSNQPHITCRINSLNRVDLLKTFKLK